MYLTHIFQNYLPQLCRRSKGVRHPGQVLRDLPRPGIVIGNAVRVRWVRTGAVREAFLHSKT